MPHRLDQIDLDKLSPEAKATLDEIVRVMVEEDLDERAVAKRLGLTRVDVDEQLQVLRVELADQVTAIADTRRAGGRSG